MENKRGEMHIETDEARAGATPHIVRWVLAISLFAAIVLLTIIWITGALTRDGSQDATQVGPVAEELQEGSTTDGVLSDGFDEIGPEPIIRDGDGPTRLPN